MTKRWIKRAVVLALCAAFSCQWAFWNRNQEPDATPELDFGHLYFGARCVIEHHDPYDGKSALHIFQADGGKFAVRPPADPKLERLDIAVVEYPPTGLFVVAPLALLRWPVAEMTWFWLMAGLLVLAALLTWDLAEDAPVAAGFMAGFMLLNCVVLIGYGNPAGIVTPLCVIAAWCFLKERWAPVGVALLALCLMMKPQTAGFVWLHFLLAGGAGRKRSLQTLAVTVVLGVGAVMWIAPWSPHWVTELRGNIAVLSVRGGLNDVGPSGATYRNFDPVICLQSAASVFRDDPGFYGAVSYLIGGGLILAWAIAVVRKRATRETALLALATISILTMLPVYHRAHDAKLLLLAIPACGMLWAGGGGRRWIALGLTWAAIFVTSDIPDVILVVLQNMAPASPSTLGGKLTLLMQHPAPLVLLVAGGFYLWTFIRYQPPAATLGQEEAAAIEAAAR